MTSLQLVISSMGLAVLTLGACRNTAAKRPLKSLAATRSLICLVFIVWLQPPAYSGIQQGTATITAGQPTDDATDVMALLVNMKSYQVNITIMKTYTPAKKAAEIAAAIDAAKIPGVKTAVNNNVVTITGATKFAYADNSAETGLKLASAGPASNNGVVVTLGYTGTPSDDDATYVATFGDSVFNDTASMVFPEPPSLDTLLDDIYTDLKQQLPTALQSRLTLDLSSDTIAFIFPSSSDQFVQNYTSDGEVTANQSIQGVIPELSTWAMLLIGFAGLAYAGHRAARRSPHGRQSACEHEQGSLSPRF
jgi:hypothetical protein